MRIEYWGVELQNTRIAQNIAQLLERGKKAFDTMWKTIGKNARKHKQHVIFFSKTLFSSYFMILLSLERNALRRRLVLHLYIDNVLQYATA